MDDASVADVKSTGAAMTLRTAVSGVASVAGWISARSALRTGMVWKPSTGTSGKRSASSVRTATGKPICEPISQMRVKNPDIYDEIETVETLA